MDLRPTRIWVYKQKTAVNSIQKKDVFVKGFLKKTKMVDNSQLVMYIVFNWSDQ